ncbi:MULTISPECIES: DUF5682 family protein [unclassified Streptomyces]|uniref:DUF5682 family protein n=1 Tax=unclassified Streptomyces TaxID=2593676 RepID=UPI000A5E60A5|nr:MULTISPECIES: DUF5682 family protein [unclassified Streptomyces]
MTAAAVAAGAVLGTVTGAERTGGSVPAAGGEWTSGPGGGAGGEPTSGPGAGPAAGASVPAARAEGTPRSARVGGPLVLGVRHHGPGSARGVRAALDAEKPAVVLVEGPAEADALVALAGDPGMRPPVALLAHAVDDPGRAAFWPMAEFSPEWVAIRWALDRGAAVRFIDLPAAHSLAAADPTWDDGEDEVSGSGLRIDPVAELAGAAGYEDAERWWEDVVELRGDADPTAPFEALAEAMGALREAYGHGGHPRDLVREAYMRLQLRAARKEYGEAVAVVCGAWHVPALTRRTTVAADRALLKGLPKVKTEMTWVPWTHRRLARRSGYGAGIEAPGWYAHLFAAPDRPVERWMTKVAGLLRAEDHLVSSAHVIEAVRLADTLAALRGRPLPGLDETTDAIRAVLCEGSDVPLDLVRDRLVVGDVLGEVPDGAPAVPLQRDLARRQRTLRLKPEAHERELDLDLRKDTDGERSRLLHRLRLLGVDWGAPAAGRSGTGTFREGWRLRWEPELHVQVAEAGVWGTTVEAAATARARSLAVAATGLADITALAEQCLLAGLADALPVVMRALADRAALDTDVAHLAQALPALARSLRYGDVRGTDTAALAEVAAGLAERICVGLPPACAGLDADAAAAMRERIDEVHRSLGLLPGADGLTERWAGVLRRLADRDRIPGVLRGRAARLLLDEGRLAEDEAALLMSRALSPGTPPPDAAAWIDGFVGGASGGGLLLVHDERLLGLLDDWLTGVPAEAFTDVLPLLRRTFSAYEPGVRRTLGELAARGPGSGGPGHTAPGTPGFAPTLDRERADAVLPLLHLVLGPHPDPQPGPHLVPGKEAPV